VLAGKKKTIMDHGIDIPVPVFGPVGDIGLLFISYHWYADLQHVIITCGLQYWTQNSIDVVSNNDYFCKFEITLQMCCFVHT